MSPTEKAQVRALHSQLQAALIQAGALLLGEATEGPAGGCPRCGKDGHLVEAGDVVVCGDCGANFRGTEVISG